MARSILNETLIIFTNGGSRRNLGPSATAWIIKTYSRDDLINVGLFLPHATKNIVEYAIVIGSLTVAFAFWPSYINLFTNSLLMVNH